MLFCHVLLDSYSCLSNEGFEHCQYDTDKPNFTCNTVGLNDTWNKKGILKFTVFKHVYEKQN